MRVLEGVHEGRINLNEWRDKVNMFEALTNGKLFTLTAPLSVNNNPNITNTYRDWETDRKSTRLNSSHRSLSRMPSSA